MQKGMCAGGDADRSTRIWLLYLQGRLSPVQLLALCKIPLEENNNRDQQSSIGLGQA